MRWCWRRCTRRAPRWLARGAARRPRGGAGGGAVGRLGARVRGARVEGDEEVSPPVNQKRKAILYFDPRRDERAFDRMGPREVLCVRRTVLPEDVILLVLAHLPSSVRGYPF